MQVYDIRAHTGRDFYPCLLCTHTQLYNNSAGIPRWPQKKKYINWRKPKEGSERLYTEKGILPGS